MSIHFVKSTIRSLTKRKGTNFLNIAGLSIGIACCLLAFEYVAYEKSYDSFNQKADRIWRVQDENYQNDRMVVPCAAAIPALAPIIKKQFPEVENAAGL